MAMTAEDRLRRAVGDRIPLGGDQSKCFFSNAEITDLLDEANDNHNLAALNGWLAKMAEFAKLIDTDISGANRKFSQMYKNAESMARHYAGIIGADADAIIGRVVGKAINLREDICPPAVMTGSLMGRSELHSLEARSVLANSHPDTTDVDPTYPSPGIE